MIFMFVFKLWIFSQETIIIHFFRTFCGFCSLIKSFKWIISYCNITLYLAMLLLMSAPYGDDSKKSFMEKRFWKIIPFENHLYFGGCWWRSLSTYRRWSHSNIIILVILRRSTKLSAKFSRTYERSRSFSSVERSVETALVWQQFAGL